MKNWKTVVIQDGSTLREGIEKINLTGYGIVLVTDADFHLKGTLTDGDVRRAVLKGIPLDAPVTSVMNSTPTVANESDSRLKIKSLIQKSGLSRIPIANTVGKVCGMVSIEDCLSANRDNKVVIMAGGLGSRLGSLTEHCPKPLLRVGGQPIMELLINNLSGQGFWDFLVSVNYKAEMIKDHFGNGSSFGVQMNYLHESSRLGTAGALSLISDVPAAPIIVVNADILVEHDFGKMIEFHEEHAALATMAVREYEFQVPYGVVMAENGKIRSFQEKPIQKVFVNSGIYVLSPQVLSEIPRGKYFDMPELFKGLQAKGRDVHAYPLTGYWRDIGRVDDLERANGEVGNFSDG